MRQASYFISQSLPRINDVGFTPEERKQLRLNYKDEAEVKDIFHELRTNQKQWIARLERRKQVKPQEAREIEQVIDDFNQRLHLFDMLEAIVLNQIEIRKFLEECIDASLMQNPKQKLKKLRAKMEEAIT